MILYAYQFKIDIYEGFDVEELAKELEDIAKTGKDPSSLVQTVSEEGNKIMEDDLNLLDDDAEEEEAEEGANKIVSEEEEESVQKYMSKMTPAKAQRETFRLINTMKQLEDTLKGMEPVLKRGANVIDKMKKLNLG